MVAVWLASFPDGACETKNPDSTHGLFQVPAKDSVRNLLQQHGGPSFDKQVLSALGGGHSVVDGQVDGRWKRAMKHIQVVGLMRLSSTACAYYVDSLSHFSEEAIVQQEYHNMPIDGYELDVQDVASCCFPDDFNITHRRESKNIGTAGQANISLKKPLFHPVWMNSPGAHTLSVESELAPRSVDAVLQAWGLEG